jgi:hypothetical protein
MAAIGRERHNHRVQYGLHFVSESLKARMDPAYNPRISGSYHKLVDYLKTEMSIEAMQDASEMLENLHYYIERNAHIKMHLLNTSLKLRQVIIDKQRVPVEGITR